MSDDKPGVYYAKADCAGLLRRIAIDAVDAVVLLAIWFLLVVGAIVLRLPADLAELICKLMIPIGWFLYLVILKHFATTLGYLVCGVTIVNLQGIRPSFAATCIRAPFFFLAPFEYFFDLIWLTSDPNFQAIRDKYSRTYVIRREAQPAGTGRMRHVFLDSLNLALILPEVARNESAQAAGIDAQRSTT